MSKSKKVTIRGQQIDVLDSPLSVAELKELVDSAGYITVVIAVAFDEFIDGMDLDTLNNIADEQIAQQGTLEAIEYRPVAVDGDDILIEVTASVDAIMAEYDKDNDGN